MIPLVAFDTETALITDLVLAPQLVCVTWAQGGQSGIFKWNGDPYGPNDAHDLVQSWLVGATLIGHNVAFDLGVIAAQWPDLLPTIFAAYDEGRIKDTGIRQKLLDIAHGRFRGYTRPDGTWEKVTYHLADVARRHLGITMAKGEDTWRMRYIELYDVPLAQWPEDASGYAIKDAVTTLSCYEVQERLRYVGANRTDLLADEANQVRAAFWLHLVGCWGMRVDIGKIAALEASITEEFETVRDLLLDEGLLKSHTPGRGKNAGITKYTRDTKAAAERMREACALEEILVRETAKGGVCLDEDACTDSADPVLEAYANYAGLQNVLGKDVKHLRCGEIHGRFDSLVASTRTSCRGFNLQNLRRKGGTRGCFVPRCGFEYLLIDLDTAELRAVAQVCIELFRYSRLAEKINEGIDVHCFLAAESIRVPYEEVLAGYKAGDSRMSDERQTHKNANFGLWGGMREKRFRALVIHGLKESLAEARRKGDEAKCATLRKAIESVTEERIWRVRQAWLRTWPESKAYLDLHERLCSHGALACFEQVPGVWRGGMRYSEACNSRFQSRIAAAMKAAGWAVSRECYVGRGALRGSRVVNFPHDELILEVPSDRGHECAEELQRIVLAEVGKWLPDVPPKATPYLSRYWSKDAFAVFDDFGRLVPWNGHAKVRKAA